MYYASVASIMAQTGMPSFLKGAREREGLASLFSCHAHALVIMMLSLLHSSSSKVGKRKVFLFPNNTPSFWLLFTS